MNNVKKQYFREIKRLLTCNAKEKKRCIMELDHDVDDFLESCPSATFEALCAAVGSPQAVARSFLERIDPEQLSQKLSAKRKVSTGIIVVAAVLALAIGILYAATTYMRHDFYDGYYVETFDSAPAGTDPTPSALAKY